MRFVAVVCAKGLRKITVGWGSGWASQVLNPSSLKYEASCLQFDDIFHGQVGPFAA